MNSVSCILLAAGSSSRFGSDKMLHRLQDGLSMLETTAKQYLAVFDSITVVVPSIENHPLSGRTGIELVSTDSCSAMSTSLKAGISANISRAAWLIALGDMPYIRAATISQLRDRMTDSNIVLPMWRQRQGNPVGFGCVFKDQLLAIKGDRGAKSIIKQHPESVVELSTHDRGVIHDIDLPTDLL